MFFYPTHRFFFKSYFILNSHIWKIWLFAKIVILNMTIWIWLFFWKFWEYDYLQYDYYFRKSEIWLFAIWLFFEKIWRNMTICNTSNIFSFDDSRIIWNFAGKTSLSGAILVSFLLAVEVIRGIWFPEKPLSLNSHIQKYDYLNMTIILRKY